MTPANKNDLKGRLARYRQIKLSVIGRKTGQTISIPVWFVLEGDKLYLLPVRGSDTQWYRNVLKNPSIRIDARGAEAELRAAPIKDAKSVKSVVEKFREKYGESDVKKYYAKFDVAGLAEPIYPAYPHGYLHYATANLGTNGSSSDLSLELNCSSSLYSSSARRGSLAAFSA